MSYKGESGLAQIVADILGTARGCRRLASGVIVTAGTLLDYSACPRAHQDMSEKLDVLQN